MTIRELYRETVQRLQTGGIEEAETEAFLLLGHLLGLSRTQLVLAGEQPVAIATSRRWEQLLARRLRREPLAYILGEWEFWSLPFEVSPAVLIPRPETELLIETAIEALKTGPGTASPLVPNHGMGHPGSAYLPTGKRLQGAGDARHRPALCTFVHAQTDNTADPVDCDRLRLLDLGAGSGIIPVVLARELPQAAVYSLDCSPAALDVAARNARRHGVADRVRFIASDWLRAIGPRPIFDAVISNPPYIDCRVLADLQPEVRDFEPHLALDGGPGGLGIIERLSREIAVVLKPGGRLFMEIGFDQGETAAAIFEAAGHYREILVRRDYAGHPRVLAARKKG